MTTQSFVLFNAPLYEFATKKAAEKRAARMNCKTEIRKGKSVFDMYATKSVYQIFERE